MGCQKSRFRKIDEPAFHAGRGDQGGHSNRAQPEGGSLYSRHGRSDPGTQFFRPRSISAERVNLGTPTFEKSVFINCPFDEDFSPILQAIAFCVVYLGFSPRLAPENSDNSVARLDRIVEIVKGSKYGIHDLSRCRSKTKNEYARMNMPFELGIDHACSRFGGGPYDTKTILILEEKRYDYQKALSDISGWDIEPHGGKHEKAVAKVRTWLAAQTGERLAAPAKILGEYAAFQEWYWERELAAGASEDDIREYPTVEMIKAMHEWMALGKPV